LERELAGQAQVIRVNVMSQMGLDLARRYGIRATPTLLVFDGAGNVVYTQPGIPDQATVLEAVSVLGKGP
jgi:thioredoxin-related protein